LKALTYKLHFGTHVYVIGISRSRWSVSRSRWQGQGHTVVGGLPSTERGSCDHIFWKKVQT